MGGERKEKEIKEEKTLRKTKQNKSLKENICLLETLWGPSLAPGCLPRLGHVFLPRTPDPAGAPDQGRRREEAQ
jgi:hypothetical protein